MKVQNQSINYTKIIYDKEFNLEKVLEHYNNKQTQKDRKEMNFIINFDNFVKLKNTIEQNPIALKSIKQLIGHFIGNLFLIGDDISLENIGQQKFIQVRQPNGKMFISTK